MPIPVIGTTQVYGILGYPVSHTFSPPIHNLAFETLKLNAVYLPFKVLPEQLKPAIEGIRSLDIAGVNVTIPHKINVLPHLDEITPTAEKIGAVNTIRNEDGRLIGTNTDGLGLLRSFQKFPFSPKQKTILILGAGGSTRSAIVALAEAQAKTIYLINRTIDKAQKLAEEFSPIFPDTSIEVTTPEKLKHTPIDLLINTTSVGMKSSETPLDLNQFSQIRHVVDIIYSPQKTVLLEQANTLDIPFINGVGMLLHQACEAFQFWTNHAAPVTLMENELLKLLKS